MNQYRIYMNVKFFADFSHISVKSVENTVNVWYNIME